MADKEPGLEPETTGDSAGVTETEGTEGQPTSEAEAGVVGQPQDGNAEVVRNLQAALRESRASGRDLKRQLKSIETRLAEFGRPAGDKDGKDKVPQTVGELINAVKQTVSEMLSSHGQESQSHNALAYSEAQARQLFDDYDDLVDEYIVPAIEENPILGQALMSLPNPGIQAYFLALVNKAIEMTGGDVVAIANGAKSLLSGGLGRQVAESLRAATKGTKILGPSGTAKGAAPRSLSALANDPKRVENLSDADMEAAIAAAKGF